MNLLTRVVFCHKSANKLKNDYFTKQKGLIGKLNMILGGSSDRFQTYCTFLYIYLAVRRG